MDAAAAAAARAAELVEVIDEAGNVVDIVDRAAMRARVLRHRCTVILVLAGPDEAGPARILVHRRADWKDVYPGWWDVGFGGVCGVGEHWVSAARRELAEEAGYHDTALWPLGSDSYDGPDGSVLFERYVTLVDAEPRCDDGEVVETAWVPLADFPRWADGRQICLDSRAVLVPLITPGLVDRVPARPDPQASCSAPASRVTASPKRAGSPEE